MIKNTIFANLNLQIEHPQKMEVALGASSNELSLNLELPESIFENALSFWKLKKYAKKLIRAMPAFLWASFETHSNIAEWYDQHQLKRLPYYFNSYLDWVHIIHPRAYRVNFS